MIKVERLIDEYGLDTIGEELEERWTGVSGERSSLRELSRVFNIRMIERALERAGAVGTRDEAERIHRVFTEDVSRGARIQVRRELERQGVDVESLEGDLVSHQAIHTYLTEVRGVEFEDGSADDQRERTVQTLQRLTGRTLRVTENSIERLSTAEEITVGELDVYVEVRVMCDVCGADLPVVEMIEAGGCDCRVKD